MRCAGSSQAISARASIAELVVQRGAAIPRLPHWRPPVDINIVAVIAQAPQRGGSGGGCWRPSRPDDARPLRRSWLSHGGGSSIRSGVIVVTTTNSSGSTPNTLGSIMTAHGTSSSTGGICLSIISGHMRSWPLLATHAAFSRATGIHRRHWQRPSSSTVTASCTSRSVCRLNMHRSSCRRWHCLNNLGLRLLPKESDVCRPQHLHHGHTSFLLSLQRSQLAAARREVLLVNGALRALHVRVKIVVASAACCVATGSSTTHPGLQLVHLRLLLLDLNLQLGHAHHAPLVRGRRRSGGRRRSSSTCNCR